MVSVTRISCPYSRMETVFDSRIGGNYVSQLQGETERISLFVSNAKQQMSNIVFSAQMNCFDLMFCPLLCNVAD